MKLVLGFLLLAVVLSGCLEIEEKPPEPVTPPVPPIIPDLPDIDLNVPIDVNSDTNSTDTNQPVDINTPVIETPTKYDCILLENQTKIDICLYDFAQSNLDIDTCFMMEALDKDECVRQIALQTKERFECLQIKKVIVKNACLNTLGIELLDLTFCNDIESNQELKDSCISTILPSDNVSECLKIFDTIEKEDCLFNEAAAKSDYSSCARISGSIRQGKFLRDLCLDQIYSSFTEDNACSLYFVEAKQQDCYEDIAIKINSIDTCKKLEDVTRQSNCINTVVKVLDDQNQCSEILREATQQDCYEHFAANNLSLEYCDAVTDPEIVKECYKDVAVANLDDAICDMIYDISSTQQTDCYVQIAAQTNAASTCAKIYTYHFDAKDTCTNGTAQATQDFSICENIHFAENYISCYSSIAITVNNYGICDQMEKDFLTGLGFNPKWGCYKEYAISKNDSLTCELILPASIKEECLAALESG